MLSIETLSGEELRADSALQSAINRLASPSYVNPTAILKREFIECTKAYLARDAANELICFYLTAWHKLPVNSMELPAVHLGLSATRQDTKSRGHITTLYSKCVEDAQAWQKTHGEKLVLWSTTASPTVYLAVSGYLADAEPRPDGSYTERGATVAAALHRRLGRVPPGEDDHPFVVKGVAIGTRYSSEELGRIERITRLKQFVLFHHLGVDESQHDRLLFIARIPDDFRGRN